eukprot:GHRQ01025076.1.p1 GENE.GHRQ01025076.1~~GHRQ01025076.1.p1  ORF type:complete len:221 (+),score=40.73 GHRQ01025076.1:220-882(+)
MRSSSAFSLLARVRALVACQQTANSKSRIFSVHVRHAGTYVDRQGYEHFGSRGSAWGSHTTRLVLGGAAAGSFAYYWSCRQEVPYTHRHHAIMMVSQKMELHIGQQTFQQVTQEATATNTLLPQNSSAAHLVRRVGLRIAQVAADGAGGGYYKHMQNLDWEFAVINSPDVNAFVAPGGKVVVFSGAVHHPCWGPVVTLAGGLSAHQCQLMAAFRHHRHCC